MTLLINGVLTVALIACASGVVWGQEQFKTELSGYDELPTLSATGSGDVTVEISKDGASLTVTLTFSRLEGVAQSARLYIGKAATNGGAVAPICGSPKPSCPTTADGKVTATISANDIIGSSAQGIAPSDIAGVVRALENGAVYVNIVSSKYVNGELRGQIARGLAPVGNRGRGRQP